MHSYNLEPQMPLCGKIMMTQFFKLTTASLLMGWLVLSPIHFAWSHGGHEHGDEPNISLPNVVAKVNGKDIKKDSIWAELTRSVKKYKARGIEMSAEQEKIAAKKLLEEEINKSLLMERATTLGIQVPEEKVEKKVNIIKNKFKNESMFMQRLMQENLSFHQYKQRIRDDMMMDAVIDKELGDSIKIPDADIKKYFQENKEKLSSPEKRRASVILIKVNPKSGPSGEEAARDKLNMILKKLKEGVPFGDLAKQFSQDSIASRGGDLGVFTQDSHMYAPFRQQAFKLKKDEVSPIFRTKHGLHILKVTAVHPEVVGTLENSKDQIRQTLKEQAIKNQTRPYLEGLRKEASVKIYF